MIAGSALSAPISAEQDPIYRKPIVCYWPIDFLLTKLRCTPNCLQYFNANLISVSTLVEKRGHGGFFLRDCDVTGLY